MRSKKQVMGGESGRSMLETLGVLAIMGLLVIGGVMAYRYAVTKYQANETFNELRRRVIVHSQQSIVGTPLSQVELGDKTQLGYPIAVAAIEKGFFELTLQDIDNNLCREVVRTGWTLPIQTRVNGVVVGTNPAACRGENVLVFRFQTEMGGCKTDEECPCGTCANGVCRTSCSNGESCVKDFNDGQYVCCPGESVKGQFCCETVNEAGECCDSTGKCCPPEKPLIDAYGKCWACDDTRSAIGLQWTGLNWQQWMNVCQRCDNRIFVQGVHAWSYCSIPCPDGQIYDMSGQCHDCNQEGMFLSSVTECLKCEHRFLGEEGNIARACYRCDAPSVFAGRSWNTPESLASCEQKCPNRKFLHPGIYPDSCALLPCPIETPIMDDFGHCHSCDDPTTFGMKLNPQACLSCVGKKFLGTYGGWVTNCYSCDNDQQSIQFGNSTPAYAVNSCNECPNRHRVNAYCAKYCENGKIWDNKGQCHTCDEEEDFNVQGVPENKCACPGVRYLDGNTCKKCPEDLSALTPEQQAQCGG